MADGTSDSDDEGDGQPGADTPDPEASDGSGGIAVLVAIAVFGLSLLALPVTMALGIDVLPAVASNAAAAVAIVIWTARHTFADPDSSVSTVPGAFGTALVVLGAYGLLLAGGLTLAGPFHDRGALVGPIAAAGGVAGLLGLGTFAFEAVFSSGDDAAGKHAEGGGTDDEKID